MANILAPTMYSLNHNVTINTNLNYLFQPHISSLCLKRLETTHLLYNEISKLTINTLNNHSRIPINLLPKTNHITTQLI